MPPKKKSKKQEELERKAEEERLAALAEQERLERERQEREERERQMKEEDDAWIEEHKGIFAKQIEDFEPTKKMRASKIEAMDALAVEEEDWHRFTQCSRLPDARSVAEVNAFVEEVDQVYEKEVGPNASLFSDCEAVVLDLALQSVRAKGMEKQDKADAYDSLIKKVEANSWAKLDHACADMLVNHEKYIDAKNEVIDSWPNEFADVGLWANTAKNVRMKHVEFSAINVSIELPKALILGSTAIRVVKLRRDDKAGASTGSLRTVGGVFYLQCFALPPAARGVKNMHMRTLSVEGPQLAVFPYPPMEQMSTGGNAPGPQPLRVSMKISADVFVSASPRVGWFDPEKQAWDETHVSEVAFDTETRTLSFASPLLGAFALVQERTAALPYSSWAIWPNSAKSVRFEVNTAVDRVEFEAGSGTASIVENGEAGKDALRPLELIQKLQSQGLSLSPQDDDASFVKGTKIKNPEVEAFAAAQIASCCSAYAFKYSKHNYMVDDNTIVVQAKPWNDWTENPTESTQGWRLIQFRIEPLTMVATSSVEDADEDWKVERVVEIQAAASLQKLMEQEMATDKATEAMTTISPLLIETARQLLGSVRPFCFAMTRLVTDNNAPEEAAAAENDEEQAAEETSEAAQGEGETAAAEGEQQAAEAGGEAADNADKANSKPATPAADAAPAEGGDATPAAEAS